MNFPQKTTRYLPAGDAESLALKSGARFAVVSQVRAAAGALSSQRV